MRKPRDFDSEMKTLNERAKLLKERKLRQLGELVIATGADALPIEHLAGVLLVAIEINDAAVREDWRTRGTAFFRSTPRSAARGPHSRARGASPDGGSPQPAAGEAGAQ